MPHAALTAVAATLPSPPGSAGRRSGFRRRSGADVGWPAGTDRGSIGGGGSAGTGGGLVSSGGAVSGGLGGGVGGGAGGRLRRGHDAAGGAHPGGVEGAGDSFVIVVGDTDDLEGDSEEVLRDQNGAPVLSPAASLQHAAASPRSSYARSSRASHPHTAGYVPSHHLAGEVPPSPPRLQLPLPTRSLAPASAAAAVLGSGVAGGGAGAGAPMGAPSGGLPGLGAGGGAGGGGGMMSGSGIRYLGSTGSAVSGLTGGPNTGDGGRSSSMEVPDLTPLDAQLRVPSAPASQGGL